MIFADYMSTPFKKLNLDKNEINAVTKLIKSGMIGLGSTVFEFEELFAKYLGAKYVVATDSCTSAIFLSLKWRKIEMTEKNYSIFPQVKVPTQTVPLVPDAVLEAGLIPY